MKKIALLLSCFICLGMLTACGGGSEKIPPAAGADPFGYIEQGVLGMEEGQAAALDEDRRQGRSGDLRHRDSGRQCRRRVNRLAFRPKRPD